MFANLVIVCVCVCVCVWRLKYCIIHMGNLTGIDQKKFILTLNFYCGETIIYVHYMHNTSCSCVIEHILLVESLITKFTL